MVGKLGGSRVDRAGPPSNLLEQIRGTIGQANCLVDPAIAKRRLNCPREAGEGRAVGVRCEVFPDER